jgi:26S proteasome non-ATPase regulatory subunit 9
MASGSVSSGNSKKDEVREELLKLNTERNKIESDIKEFMEILDTHGVGMKEPLVDAEGFPRSDIDVYTIRTARNKIITLENDCRAVMKTIEKKLEEFHALTK